ncbi:hypothetical protein [Halomicronema sp. CCY15110]|uniref:hypothetical protein n=1 Tax=Halomicronema sp. CCY15110 TaxID=2767773 RepID=UPI00194F1A9A|nr:hypothetical protein [Halomicronema sp. CCY15110]
MATAIKSRNANCTIETRSAASLPVAMLPLGVPTWAVTTHCDTGTNAGHSSGYPQRTSINAEPGTILRRIPPAPVL